MRHLEPSLDGLLAGMVPREAADVKPHPPRPCKSPDRLQRDLSFGRLLELAAGILATGRRHAIQQIETSSKDVLSCFVAVG